ncbi:MAG TPA: hypothetical protein VG816_12275 [Solirubrobacterales bacterium]|nr:hypothetical protein [Solirubrobacterales bacterium]
MTLAEFLHPIRSSPKREQVVAALYFFKYHEGKSPASVDEIRKGLIRANIPRSRNANLSAVLARLIPLVDRMGAGYWRITKTGEAQVRERLALADPSPQAQEDVNVLSRLARSVEDETVRDYVEEAIKCLQIGARRAAVVFLWSGAVHDIRERIWTKGKGSIEEQLRRRNPKAKFRRKDDFAYVKDVLLIELTGDLGIFEKSERKRLGEALDLRNDCGHPVKYRPGEKKVSSFIEDLLQVVFGASS